MEHASRWDHPAAELYLDLLKRVLTRSAFPDAFRNLAGLEHRGRRRLQETIQRALSGLRLALVGLPKSADAARLGPDLTTYGETMMGLPRLDNLHECIRDVVRRGVPGDFIETGVWRGGATIFMRAALKAYGVIDRIVWVADSFEGVPAANPDLYPADAGHRFRELDVLAVPRKEVEANFERFGLMDEQVRFLEGWFRDTLPSAPMERLAVIRLDGDIYESTMDALHHLYPKLSDGGYLIVDDYGAVDACRQAVEDYRAKHGIHEPLRRVEDWQASCVWWRREGE